jgi:hypothetical protein
MTGHAAEKFGRSGDFVRIEIRYRRGIMDILIGVFFAVFLIVVSTIAGRSLDRAKRRAADTAHVEKTDLYGDF